MRTSSEVASFCAGVVLLIGASAKITDFGHFELPIGLPSWAALPIAVAEAALGLSLLLVYYRTSVRLIAAAAFGGFAMIAAISLGDESCGCFGAVKQSPLTIMIVDLMVMASLALTIGASHSKTTDSRRFSRLVGCTVIVFGFLAISTSFRRLEKATTTADSVVPGSRFDLLEQIDVDRDLSRGEWIVLFWRPGCHVCEHELTLLRRNLHSWTLESLQGRIALIQVGSNRSDLSSSYGLPQITTTGTLRLEEDELFETPLVVGLHDGIVVYRTTGLDWGTIIRLDDEVSAGSLSSALTYRTRQTVAPPPIQEEIPYASSMHRQWSTHVGRNSSHGFVESIRTVREFAVSTV